MVVSISVGSAANQYEFQLATYQILAAQKMHLCALVKSAISCTKHYTHSMLGVGTFWHLATKPDLAEMLGMETRLVKWMIGVMFGGVALFLVLQSSLS